MKNKIETLLKKWLSENYPLMNIDEVEELDGSDWKKFAEWVRSKTKIKPLEWKEYPDKPHSFSSTVCSTITSAGYAEVSKNDKGYKAYLEGSSKQFETLPQAKAYIEEQHKENLLRFIDTISDLADI